MKCEISNTVRRLFAKTSSYAASQILLCDTTGLVVSHKKISDKNGRSCSKLGQMPRKKIKGPFIYSTRRYICFGKSMSSFSEKNRHFSLNLNQLTCWVSNMILIDFFSTDSPNITRVRCRVKERLAFADGPVWQNWACRSTKKLKLPRIDEHALFTYLIKITKFETFLDRVSVSLHCPAFI